MVNYDYLYNKEYYGDDLNKNYISNKKLGCRIISNGIVLPHKQQVPGHDMLGGGGVVDNTGKYIEGTFLHDNPSREYKPASIRYSNETVIYIGMFVAIWGHCLTDNIKRLWFLKSDIYKKYFNGYKLIYIPMWNFDFETNAKNFKRLLQIWNIDFDNFKSITEAIQYKNIIIPDVSFGGSLGDENNVNAVFTNEYKETINYIRQFALQNYVPNMSFKKLYFMHGRKQIGEELIAQYFNSKGYTLVFPERLTFEEQLNILVNCESFASTAGSCSHNMIFLRENTEVILIPRGAYLTGYQEILNQLFSLNITYIDSTLSLFVNNLAQDGPFFYFVSDKLKKYFGDCDEDVYHYTEADFKMFIKYFKYSMSQGLKFNHEYMKYYIEVFNNFLDQLKQQRTLLQEEKFHINKL